jgi:hypothetical protein
VIVLVVIDWIQAASPLNRRVMVEATVTRTKAADVVDSCWLWILQRSAKNKNNNAYHTKDLGRSKEWLCFFPRWISRSRVCARTPMGRMLHGGPCFHRASQKQGRLGCWSYGPWIPNADSLPFWRRTREEALQLYPGH